MFTLKVSLSTQKMLLKRQCIVDTFIVVKPAVRNPLSRFIKNALSAFPSNLQQSLCYGTTFRVPNTQESEE